MYLVCNQITNPLKVGLEPHTYCYLQSTYHGTEH